MLANIVATNFGRPASAALAQSILDAKAGVALAPVTVIVPSNFAGLAARRMLGGGLLGVDGIANVSFTTPFRFAELLALGELQGKKPLTKPVLTAAVRRALRDDPRHFRGVRDHQATERALAEVVGELSNVSGRSLASLEDADGQTSSIVGLYREIKSHLRGFHDEADVARAAAQRTDLADAVTPFGHIIWYLPAPASAPLMRFLHTVFAVAPTTAIVATTGDGEIDRDLLASVGLDQAPQLASVESPAAPPIADHIISVTDADEEVRAVIREVMQLVDSGVALDRIGIFHPAPDPYVRILEQQLAAAEIPANGPSRRRISESIAGRVLLAALALPAERWRRDRVIALVNSGPLRHDGHPARPAVWDTLSRRAGVVGGLADWRGKLAVEANRINQSHERAAEVGSERRMQILTDQHKDVESLTSFIESLAALVAGVESATGWTSRAEAATTLLHALLGRAHVHTWWPEPEQEAFERVELALERVSMLEEIDPSPTMAVFVRALTGELSVARGRSGRFGDGLVYGPLASAPGHDLDAVFVLGCIEGLCPMPRREDVLLPDRARRMTHGELPERLKQIHEQHRIFLAALAAAPEGRRWLFLPRGDLRSSRRSRPSRWLLPTASHLAGRQLYATDFEHASPDGVYELQSHATAMLAASQYANVEERDLAKVLAHTTAGGEAIAHPAARLVERGLLAQIARAGPSFTEFDGYVTAHGGLDSSGPMSASKYETWATCGFRYYLAYVLGLRERDDPERVIELSALDRGSAMHAVLEQFLTEVIETGTPSPHEPWSEEQRARARQIAEEIFSEYERRGRTGRPVEWQTQKSDLLALVDEFLTADDQYRAATGAQPAFVEMPFGLQERPPLTIALDDGRTLAFRGMIDRVDRGQGGRHLVSDYKTGKGRAYKDLAKVDDPTKEGTLLQLGLYAEAVSQHVGGDAVETHYWMVNTEAGHARYGYPWTPDHRTRLLDVLTTIADGIDDGVFAANPGEWQSHYSTYENCTYCEFDSICPRSRAEHAADKADAPELAVRVALQLRPNDDAQAESTS